MYTDNGGGAHFATGFGRSLSLLEKEIISLLENLTEKQIIFESIIEKIDLNFDKNQERKQEKKKIKMDIWEKQIDSINLGIKKISSIFLKTFDIKKEIVELDKNKILKLIQKRFERSLDSEGSIFLANENLRMALIIELKKSLDSLEKIHDYLEDKEYFEGFDKLSKNYKKYVLESIHIYSIGYGKTAVLCVGRTIEDLINKFLTKLFEKGKISNEDYEKIINSKYNDKIGFLKGKFLTEEEFIDLNSFSFKRNKGGHPNLGDIDNNRARTFIQQGIWLIIDLQKKVDEVKSETEVEQDKARKLLGGRSLHSSFLTGNSKGTSIDT